MSNLYGALITEVIHPFARAGAANTTGAIYSATVSSSAVANTYTNIETVTVPLPKNSMITELEFGLTAGYAETVTTAGFELRWAIRDTGGSSVDYLVVSTAVNIGYAGTSISGTTDVTYMGRITPSSGTYFTGKGSFDLLSDVACDSTGKAQGATKQSSYVQYSYYLLG
jgi:hypothetical protein